MSGFAQTTVLLVLLPAVVLCSYPWPDNVTQHKGYIEVGLLLVQTLPQSVFAGQPNSRSQPILLVF